MGGGGIKRVLGGGKTTRGIGYRMYRLYQRGMRTGKRNIREGVSRTRRYGCQRRDALYQLVVGRDAGHILLGGDS
jgi:hypothetical protein